jgi:hypothetical protein
MASVTTPTLNISKRWSQKTAALYGKKNITYEKKARKAGAGVVKWRVWNTST